MASRVTGSGDDGDPFTDIEVLPIVKFVVDAGCWDLG